MTLNGLCMLGYCCLVVGMARVSFGAGFFKKLGQFYSY
jgi:hypothetical protein